MKKVIISILGQDKPGIIAAVSKILFEQNCNIENVSQTILQTEFSGIFIATVSEDLSANDLHEHLTKQLRPLSLQAYVKNLEQKELNTNSPDPEPFIITTKGPDRKGLVANITEIIARHGVNVTNLQAVFKGGDDPNKNLMIYEVDIPKYTDQESLYTELREKAAALGLDISIQHRNIFEAINQI
ncbi:glycine cleavage system protein R [Desulfonema magnum]|uniref:Amino acid-binding ACT domain-containing protein n=1 Tax=Desulfonema magnum TaxID=45655 RepID=A0A975BS92_9BACT|nr:ACT domain-containing protein [Desulfonema magnum]QTA90130.1 Amino acid-binding ACT domain-containing protein [Desulfonema magnum]